MKHELLLSSQLAALPTTGFNQPVTYFENLLHMPCFHYTLDLKILMWCKLLSRLYFLAWCLDVWIMGTAGGWFKIGLVMFMSVPFEILKSWDFSRLWFENCHLWCGCFLFENVAVQTKRVVLLILAHMLKVYIYKTDQLHLTNFCLVNWKWYNTVWSYSFWIPLFISVSVVHQVIYIHTWCKETFWIDQCKIKLS